MIFFGLFIELIIDDIDYVYDNISYEDLKVMVVKREEVEFIFFKLVRDFVRFKSISELVFLKR